MRIDRPYTGVKQSGNLFGCVALYHELHHLPLPRREQGASTLHRRPFCLRGRATAPAGLGIIGERALKRAIQDKDEKVRLAAIDPLEEKEMKSVLAEAARSDSSPLVREAAREAASQLDD